MRLQERNVCCQQTQSREISCIIVFEYPYCCNVGYGIVRQRWVAGNHM